LGEGIPGVQVLTDGGQHHPQEPTFSTSSTGLVEEEVILLALVVKRYHILLHETVGVMALQGTLHAIVVWRVNCFHISLRRIKCLTPFRIRQ
jgi:hypothetical protein